MERSIDDARVSTYLSVFEIEKLVGTPVLAQHHGRHIVRFGNPPLQPTESIQNFRNTQPVQTMVVVTNSHKRPNNLQDSQASFTYKEAFDTS